ncbi:CDK5 regulatory subunit-associated protein 1 [Chlorella vulgaris]
MRAAASAPLLQQLQSLLASITPAITATRRFSDASRHAASSASSIPQDGLTLQHFIQRSAVGDVPNAQPAASTTASAAATATSSEPELGKQAPSVFLETYGCQMNTNDSEVVLAVLQQAGFQQTSDAALASVVLLNTCAIRENAEAKIWSRLGFYRNVKLAARRSQRQPPVVGVLGCMAERLKLRLLESDRLVDIVAGPDSYRDLPRLIDIVQGSSSSSSSSDTSSTTIDSTGAVQRKGGRSAAINVQLSADETYADIVPVRQPDAISAYVSIMRGCNNMCSFCIVPYTRGRERSRPLDSIVNEARLLLLLLRLLFFGCRAVRMLSDQGVKEVMLLGQNVNSYADFSSGSSSSGSSSGGTQQTLTQAQAAAQAAEAAEDPFSGVYARGFRSVYKPRRGGAASFAELLDEVAAVEPEMRIRFTSPHPKDFSDDVLGVIASRPNVCKQLHMPAQSGSSAVLQAMQRGYTRESYDELVQHVRDIIPDVALSTDMIVGFCGESEGDHAASLDLMRSVAFDQAFIKDPRRAQLPGAYEIITDDVPEAVKQRRLKELIDVYRQQLYLRNASELGRTHLVLVEGPSRRSELALTGRTDTSKRVVFQDEPVPAGLLGSMLISGGNGSSTGSGRQGSAPMVRLQPGDYVAVEVTGTGGTLQARPLARTTLSEFAVWQASAQREVMPAAVAAAAEAQAEAQRVGL